MYDPSDITLKITTDEGTETVTIPFDFSDFTEDESLRVRTLTAGDADVAKTMSAFLFVAACRQVDFDDSAFDGFHSELQRLWEHDPSILEVV